MILFRAFDDKLKWTTNPNRYRKDEETMKIDLISIFPLPPSLLSLNRHRFQEKPP